MPTLSQVRIPAPKNGSEFEDIVVSAIRSQNPSVAPVRHGRSGQEQQGVDIYFADYASRRVGVQCKCVTKFTYAEFIKEVADAERFNPPLEVFVIAIAIPRDAKLQKQIWALSEQRASGQKFRVGVWFWDDIAEDLAKSLTELSRHYPELFGAVAISAPRPERWEGDIAKHRFAAYQELWSYLHVQLLPERRRPDEDWGDALNEIALNLRNHHIELDQLHKRLGSILPDGVATHIKDAASIAQEGAFEIALSDDANVPDDASKSAERVYDLLSTAIDLLRLDLKDSGVRFN